MPAAAFSSAQPKPARPQIGLLAKDTVTSFFSKPYPANRVITAGFTYLQRIGRAANYDIWFPEALRKQLDAMVTGGSSISHEQFGAEWAAVRQFELLQESGNDSICDLDPTNLKRTTLDHANWMRGGGYRVTVATLGRYAQDAVPDELAILDRRLQDAITQMIQMLYLEEESEKANIITATQIAEGRWDYRHALPHIGVVLGAGDLFQPNGARVRRQEVTLTVPANSHYLDLSALGWVSDLHVVDSATLAPLRRVVSSPACGEYTVDKGIYGFHSSDAGRDRTIVFLGHHAGGEEKVRRSSSRRHRLAKRFFDIISLLPNEHLSHETAIGLKLPEFGAKEEWIYLAQSDHTLTQFNQLMTHLFAPFDQVNMGGLHERDNNGPEIKAKSQHMRAYGERLTPEADNFLRQAALSL